MKCRLCLNACSELRKSHFFPRAAYKIVQKETVREGFRNPNPVLITDRVALQTSKQATARLLCADCEQRLNLNGEEWVMANCWRGESFLLRSLVCEAQPSLSNADISVYRASEIRGIDISALIYFAASMFWRAAVHNWSGRSSEPAIDLGPYGEQLRTFLMGTTEFLKNCMLVVVLPPNEGQQIKHMAHPLPTRRQDFHSYSMPFLGIQFALFVGKRIPSEWREADFVRGDGNPILVDAHFDTRVKSDLFFAFAPMPRPIAMLRQITP